MTSATTIATSGDHRRRRDGPSSSFTASPPGRAGRAQQVGDAGRSSRWRARRRRGRRAARALERGARVADDLDRRGAAELAAERLRASPAAARAGCALRGRRPRRRAAAACAASPRRPCRRARESTATSAAAADEAPAAPRPARRCPPGLWAPSRIVVRPLGDDLEAPRHERRRRGARATAPRRVQRAQVGLRGRDGQREVAPLERRRAASSSSARRGRRAPRRSARRARAHGVRDRAARRGAGRRRRRASRRARTTSSFSVGDVGDRRAQPARVLQADVGEHLHAWTAITLVAS